MKLGEIKLEALMMMCPGATFNVDPDNIVEAIDTIKNDSNYCDYLANMPGIINRCFGIFEQKGILPTKQAEMSLSLGEHLGSYIKFNLNTVVSDYRAIEKIAYINGENYREMCDYRKESTDSILVPYQREGRYILVYVPKLPRISILTANNKEIFENREDIASLIPYYIKSELLYSERAEEARLARSLFETGINDIISHRESYQSAVETVYGVE